MTRAATSIFAWGIYVVVVGFTFLLVPNAPLELLGLGATDEIWIQVLGTVLIPLGYYHLRAARHEMVPFFEWTTHGRTFVVAVIVAFVVLGMAEPTMLLFAGVEAIGTIWTTWALRSSRPQTVPAG